MDADFWLNKWEANETGFHEEEVNPHLIKFAAELGLGEGTRVFVPLCGKSLDLIWIAEQGSDVVGAEISRLAIESFFREHHLEPEVEISNEGDTWSSAKISVFRSDIFALTRERLGSVQAVYDRAALIALPPETRIAYASHLSTLTDPGTRMLLLSIEYDQSEMPGPPFSVTEPEVRELYGESWSVEVLSSRMGPDLAPKFQERGLTRMVENVYLLTRKA